MLCKPKKESWRFDMVDTLVLRVHDLRKHKELVKYVNMHFKGTEKYTSEIPKKKMDELRKQNVDEKEIIDYFRTSRIGTHLIRYKRQKKVNNSGNYFFQAYENKDRDFLEFSFSIPKYIYGTNIFQFVSHIWHKSFVYYQNSKLKFNLNTSFERLIRFIQIFFKTEFIDIPISFENVEINRIDLCFNQIFRDQKSALEYLEFQKQLRKKHSRIDGDNSRDWATSMMYITKRYSAKIYHKGSEFRKHDKNELKKINREKGHNYFKVDELEKLADRILRYEITFRQKMMSDLYNTKIFRRNCPIHRRYMKIYKKVDLLYQKNQRIAERISHFVFEKSKNKFIDRNPYFKPSREEKLIYKHIQKLINRNRTFMMKTNNNTSLFNSETSRDSYFDPRAKFSKAVFNELAKFFQSFIFEFQVKEKPPISAVCALIEDYNDRNYNKLPLNEMKKFYALLLDKSFEQIKSLNLYSRATFYRYKKRFEMVGITEKHLIPYCLVKASTDFSEYHSLHELRYYVKF